MKNIETCLLNARRCAAAWGVLACLGAPGLVHAQNLAVQPHEYAQITAEGPWREPSPGTLAAAEARLIDLLLQGKVDEAQAWLKQATPVVNMHDEQGRTPLTLAVAQGSLPLVRDLLRRGAHPDRVGLDGFTPMGLAAYQGNDLIVRELLAAGANPRVVGSTGQAPLHLACFAGQTRVIALLLQTPGVDRLQYNHQGRHALAEAAYNGQLAAIEQLVAAGMRLQQPDRYNLNALHAAAMGGQIETWNYLVQQGVPLPHVLTQVLIDQVREGVVAAP